MWYYYWPVILLVGLAMLALAASHFFAIFA